MSQVAPHFFRLFNRFELVWLRPLSLSAPTHLLLLLRFLLQLLQERVVVGSTILANLRSQPLVHLPVIRFSRECLRVPLSLSLIGLLVGNPVRGRHLYVRLQLLVQRLVVLLKSKDLWLVSRVRMIISQEIVLPHRIIEVFVNGNSRLTQLLLGQ